MKRPLLICDADEVLVAFIEPLARFLNGHDYDLHLESFALTGNIRHRTSGAVADRPTVARLISDYFDSSLETAPAVPGAAGALAAIAEVADVVVLTNVEEAHRQRRQAALASLGMPYPVLANQGPKGEAVRGLAATRRGPVLFVDDLPPHHTSVAQTAPHVHRLHFVADPRLRSLIPAAPDAHARIDDWSEALPYIQRALAL
ncbi:HAD family hydrolase [Parapedomonas caeni]